MEEYAINYTSRRFRCRTVKKKMKKAFAELICVGRPWKRNCYFDLLFPCIIKKIKEDRGHDFDDGIIRNEIEHHDGDDGIIQNRSSG